jgi:hypothetical protein
MSYVTDKLENVQMAHPILAAIALGLVLMFPRLALLLVAIATALFIYAFIIRPANDPCRYDSENSPYGIFSPPPLPKQCYQ